MSEINSIWERIEAWYAAQGASHLLNAGASAEAENKLGLTFPTALKESLMRHNGTNCEYDLGMGWPHGILLSLQGIIDMGVREDNSFCIVIDPLDGNKIRFQPDYNGFTTYLREIAEDLYFHAYWQPNSR